MDPLMSPFSALGMGTTPLHQPDEDMQINFQQPQQQHIYSHNSLIGGGMMSASKQMPPMQPMPMQPMPHTYAPSLIQPQTPVSNKSYKIPHHNLYTNLSCF